MAFTAAEVTGPIKPEPGILQWGDPIASELVRLYPFDRGEDDAGSTDFEELCVGADLTKPASGSLEWAVNETGRIVQYDGVGSTSLAYAESTDPFITDIAGKDFTILWAGIIPTGNQLIPFALAALSTANAFAVHHAYLDYDNFVGADEMRFRVGKGTGTGTVLSLKVPNGRRVVSIGVHNTSADEFRLYVEGQTAAAALPPYSDTFGDIDSFHLNARLSNGLTGTGTFSCSLLACWNRAITDDEAERLIANPMLLLEREPSGDLVCEPYYRQLTQPAFPVVSRSARAVDQSDPRRAGVLIAKRANRKNDREVTVQLRGLNADERSLLESLYDQGRGLVEPFWVNIPNEGARRFIIKGPALAIIDRSAINAEAVLDLIDVTDPLDF